MGAAGVNDDGAREEELSPAEERLVALLALLRAEAPRSDRALTHAVMRTARWQLVLQNVFRVVGGFAGMTVDALAAILGIRSGPRGK
jgi:hypothetical protein